MKIINSYLVKILIPNVLVVLIAMLLVGCSAATYEYTSSPVAQSLSTPLFQAAFTPEKDSAAYFTWFQLDVKNLSDAVIEIDWNQTSYLLDGKNQGRFVWAGIEPSTVKEGTIPNDAIEPGQTFSKEISPLAKVAMAQRSDYGAGKDKPGLYGGILPPGENGILLAISANGQLLRKKLVVMITEEKK